MNGDWRPCGDYQALNDDNAFSILFGKSVFSSIDLQRPYHHIAVETCDILKTAIITPVRLFELQCMTFGLRNASQSCQRHINGVIQIIEFAFAYMDDILIASTSVEQLIDHLRIVLNRIRQANLAINFDKYSFGKSELTSLRHSVNADGLNPPKRKSIQYQITHSQKS